MLTRSEAILETLATACYNLTVVDILTDMQHKSAILGTFGALWGLAGVVAILTSATFRLAPLALTAFDFPFQPIHWISLVLIVLGMAYAEGYHGFQMRFSPRVASRSRYLLNHPRPHHVLFAPLFCMGYFHATRRRKITSFSLTAGIILLIVGVRFVRQPWRGIIDTGVIVGLGWGIASVVYFGVKALRAKTFAYSPEVPEQE